MSDIYNEQKINHIIELYKKSRERDRKKYEKKKDKPEFKLENRMRAKAHYDAHYRDVKKNNYKNNQEFNKAKGLFYYYKRTDRLELFMKKYSDKVTILYEGGFDVKSYLETGSGSGSGSDTD